MTADLSDVNLTKLSTEAAEAFTEAYHASLQNGRHSIASYYVVPSTFPDGSKVPIISWNGNDVADGATMQKTFETEMPWMHFEIQALDCHILNPAIPTTSTNPKDIEKSFSMMVLVSGFVRLEEAKTGPQRGFSETMVLVPNKDKDNKKPGQRDWSIQTQNFRYVV